MRREVRANVIFIVLLLLLITPGFIFLMKKKLNGSTRPNFMPEAAPYQIAYIQPLPAPPVPRVQPALVRDWVTQLVKERFDGEALKRRSRVYAESPEVSDQFRTELLGEFIVDYRHRIVLLHWNDEVNLSASGPSAVRMSTSTGSNYDTTSVERIDVPREVRHALQDVGYVDPPTHVWWISADGQRYAVVQPFSNITLTLPGKNGGTAIETFMRTINRSPASRPAIEVRP